MEIIIARHGLSESNKADVVGGHDTPLAPEGYQQAKDLADRLKDIKIDAIYTSTMPRAIETAAPIAERLSIKIVEDARLDEVDFGAEFVGEPHSSIKDTMGWTPGELMDTYSYDFSPWRGETYQQVESRVQSFLDDLKKEPYKLVLIVCHGGIVRCLHYLITGEKITRQPNAEELYLKN